MLMINEGRLFLAVAAIVAVGVRGLDPEMPCKAMRGRYGEPGGGSGGYAELVGVRCGGECHDAAARWGGAVGPPSDAGSPDECALACGAVPGCDVWSLEGGSCYLKREMAGPLPLLARAETALSGAPMPGACLASNRWLPPLEGLPIIQERQEADGCFLTGQSYGDAAAGACGEAAVVAAIGPAGAVAEGVAQGWWGESVAEEGDPGGCQQRCSTLGGACGGFTLLQLQPGEYPGAEEGVEGPSPAALCLLRAPMECEPAYGPRLGAVAGPPSGCLSSDDDSACEELPRCTKPDVEGEFVRDTLVPASGCGYHVPGEGPEGILGCLGGRWQMLNGGSNAILLAMAWANAISPGLLNPVRDGMRTGHTDVLDLVWTANGTLLHRRQSTWAKLGVQVTSKSLPPCVCVCARVCVCVCVSVCACVCVRACDRV